MVPPKHFMSLYKHFICDMKEDKQTHQLAHQQSNGNDALRCKVKQNKKMIIKVSQDQDIKLVTLLR